MISAIQIIHRLWIVRLVSLMVELLLRIVKNFRRLMVRSVRSVMRGILC